MTGHPVVYTVIGHPTRAYFTERARRHRLVFQAAVRLATVPTALSASAADAIRDVSGRQPEVLAPGVRLDRFPPNLRARSGPPVILFPADSSETWKGLDVVLAAVSQLLDRIPDVRLQLGGPGDHSWVRIEPGPRGLAAAGARALAVTDVLGVGDLDEMPRRYGAANVTVLASINEAFGLVLAESLACGTPVVGSAEGGIPDIVDSPDVGQTVPWGDVERLARALDEVIELSRDATTPGRCVDQAHRWGWQETIGPAHERLYEAVVSRPRRAGRGGGARRAD
jgi:glycosyltransferase involved in cell wall biosynthesis